MKETFREAMDIVDPSDNGPGVSKIRLGRIMISGYRGSSSHPQLSVFTVFPVVAKEARLS